VCAKNDRFDVARGFKYRLFASSNRCHSLPFKWRPPPPPPPPTTRRRPSGAYFFLFSVNDIPAAAGNWWRPYILYRSFPVFPAVYYYYQPGGDLRHVRETHRKFRLVLDEPPAGYRITIYIILRGRSITDLQHVHTYFYWYYCYTHIVICTDEWFPFFFFINNHEYTGVKIVCYTGMQNWTKSELNWVQ